MTSNMGNSCKNYGKPLPASKLTNGYGTHKRAIVRALSRSFVELIALCLVRTDTGVTRPATLAPWLRVGGIKPFTTAGSGSYILDMTMAETTGSAVLRYELGWE